MIGAKKICTLQRQGTATRTSTGGYSETWWDVCKFRAVVAPLKPEENKMFERDTVVATHRVLVGYRDVGASNETYMKAKNRLKVGSTIYDIESVQNFDNKHYEVYIREVTE